ncbi:MAG: hypothetical protein GXX96_30375 [Planctomycetaceae bacterium]|nr:hypothetical protein [Planctomycetaceae bacterium]
MRKCGALAIFLLLLGCLSSNPVLAADQPIPDTQSSPDWVRDALVIAMPAAAVGGCQAGVYTPAENGIRPWRRAIVRWYTSRSVRGNGAALVRQEAADGGAQLSAVVDPNADYLFEVSVNSALESSKDPMLAIWATVVDADDRVLSESQVELVAGDWASCQVSFSSGSCREVRCIVHARAPNRLPCFYSVEGFRLTRKDRAWWNPQNLFNASRTAVRLRDDRQRLIETLDPDVVAGHNGVYLNWDGYFTQRGIAVGGGHWEQEYNHLSIDDPMADQLRKDGVARELDGSEILGGRLWPGYHMCHNSPAWHTYYKEQFTRIAPEVDLLTQDNICVPSFMKWGKGCFCDRCRDGFRDWLSNRWSAEQFRQARVDDPAALDIVEYVRKAQPTIDKGRDAVLADPLLRAYIQYHYAASIDRWRDAVATARQKAGHPLAVCGNQWGADGTWANSVALSQIGDATFTETGGGSLTPQKRAKDNLAAKVGQAAGDYQRPVWLCMSSLMQAPQAAQSRLRMILGQGWATGGLPMPWSTAPGATGWFYDTEAQSCRFVQQHRALFARRERVANVGLVYSLPTHAWRRFKAFGLTETRYTAWFIACAQLLEESRVPYEVNCWWHPLLGDERVAMERLSRYQVLVLPGVDCFSDAQREAVRAFQARGGRVLSVVCPALYDADAVARPAGETLATPGDGLFEIRPEDLMQYAQAWKNPSSAAKTPAQDLPALVHRALGPDQILQTEASPLVWADLWLDDTRQVLALHLVNGDIDLEGDCFRPVEGNRWRLRLPAGLAVTEALAITPDEPSRSQPLPVEVADGWATVVVPRIECYTVVALYSDKSLTAAENVANSRRALWRAGVKRGGPPDAALSADLQKVLSLLRAGQVDAGATAAAELARRCGADGLLRAGRTR